jgi:hypothetical protein
MALNCMLQYSQMPRCGVSRTIRSFRLGMVEPLGDGFLFCSFLAKLSVLSLDLAGTVKNFPNLFVYLLELV